MKYRNTSLNKPIPNSTHPSRPVKGREKEMILNDAGGYTFKIPPFKMLERFLILGSEGGTYYVSEGELTERNISSLKECLKLDYKRAIDLIAEISDSGRAPKNDPAIFALAACVTDHRVEVRKYALSKLASVCRIGTHLFAFVDHIKNMRGFGKAVRNAISLWYLSKSSMALSLQLAKYQNRNGWTHKDVIRLNHPRVQDMTNTQKNLISWAVGKEYDADGLVGLVRAHSIIYGNQENLSVDELVSIISDYKVPRELIPTKFLNDARVWKAMLPHMGGEAIVRNLGKMTSCNVFDSPEEEKLVIDCLSSPEWIKNNRLHPLKSLIAYKQYGYGMGTLGNNTWDVNRRILNALENAFYLGFKAVVPTGKRFLIALDVSGSMTVGSIAGSGVTPREAETALSLVTLNTEKEVHVCGFSDYVVPINIRKRMTINNACKIIENMRYGGTDASLVFKYAINSGLDVDAIVCFTDNESWASAPYYYNNERLSKTQHPYQALNDYRDRVGHDVKLITVAMTATRSSIGDQLDENALDVVGFDTSVPDLISNFVR